jgi:O-methyltransferase
MKGMVPDTLTKVNIEKVCYLSLDMNCALPEIAAANFFWDKIVKGGMILLDDYGLVQYQEQKIAFNEFAKEKNIEILSLPTGQGLIVKV